MGWRMALAAGWLAAAMAQEPAPPEKPALENNGKPMLVDYRCSEDDIQGSGLSCTAADPCPVYLELSAVEAVGNRIFVAGNIHTSATTLYSVLLASGDGGKTWREPHERLRGAGLDHIQFVDFENGWISGETLHPLPRDPFLLITSDGGKEWRREMVSGDPEFGSILQFWFSSRSAGKLVLDRGQPGDRYELYETANGGESWNLKETSERAMKVKGPAPNTDWRVRADAGSKSWHLERHGSDGWHSLAAFDILMGKCMAPEVDLTSPPAE